MTKGSLSGVRMKPLVPYSSCESVVCNTPYLQYLYSFTCNSGIVVMVMASEWMSLVRLPISKLISLE